MSPQDPSSADASPAGHAATAPGGDAARSVSIGVLAIEDEAGPLVLAIDAVDDALRHLDQELRRALRVKNIDVLALQFIDRRQRRGASTRVGDLVPQLGVSSGTATMIVQRLERAHLVESETDPDDGRGRRIVLGLRAHELVEGRLGGVRTGLRELVQSLQPEQEDELVELLDRVRQILRRSTEIADDERVDSGLHAI